MTESKELTTKAFVDAITPDNDNTTCVSDARIPTLTTTRQVTLPRYTTKSGQKDTYHKKSISEDQKTKYKEAEDDTDDDEIIFSSGELVGKEVDLKKNKVEVNFNNTIIRQNEKTTKNMVSDNNEEKNKLGENKLSNSESDPNWKQAAAVNIDFALDYLEEEILFEDEVESNPNPGVHHRNNTAAGVATTLERNEIQSRERIGAIYMNHPSQQNRPEGENSEHTFPQLPEESESRDIPENNLSAIVNDESEENSIAVARPVNAFVVDETDKMVIDATAVPVRRSPIIVVFFALICLIICIIIGVSVYISSTNGNEFVPLPTPTESSKPTSNSSSTFICFEFTDELRAAVVQYFEEDNNGTVKSKYGNSMGSWCVEKIQDFSYLFCGDESFCYNFYNPVGSVFNEDISAWDTSSATDMSFMFYGSTAFDGDLSSWNVSKVSNMNGMFQNATSFSSDLSSWDVSNVTVMSSMFSGATSFNSNLSSWNISSVTDMSAMFNGATSFNGDVSTWDVSSVYSMTNMFESAASFHSDLSSWSVSQVISMDNMFLNAVSFDSDVSQWNVSKVTSMNGMFQGATSFNSDLSRWDVSFVSSMAGMFDSATSFDGDLSLWNVSQVFIMAYMFFNATSFKGDVSQWDVSNVNSMNGMFQGATLFNSDLSLWNVSNVFHMVSMFQDATTFRQNLCSWGTILPPVEAELDSSGDASMPLIGGNDGIFTGGTISSDDGDVSFAMFTGTNCSTEASPNLTADVPGPFCFECVS